jgi:hypothetical protein
MNSGALMTAPMSVTARPMNASSLASSIDVVATSDLLSGAVRPSSIVLPVGHLDSRTTLEVYAQVQQRLSRQEVHKAFDDLLASAGEPTYVPTDASEKMSRSTIASSLDDAENGAIEGHDEPGGPLKWSTNTN